MPKVSLPSYTVGLSTSTNVVQTWSPGPAPAAKVATIVSPPVVRSAASAVSPPKSGANRRSTSKSNVPAVMAAQISIVDLVVVDRVHENKCFMNSGGCSPVSNKH